MIIERDVKLLYGGKKILKHLVFKEIDYDTAKKMVIENHYSHKWNTAFGKINVGVFENNQLLGVASYGNLMNPKSYKQFNKDFEQDSVIELNRLWVDDKLGGNTETVLMKASFDIIKKLYPHIKAIQSFADGRLGCGTIYKAMNFKYYGYTESLFYESDDGKTYHKVPMENTARPNGMIKLNALYVRGKLKPFKVKTYRYIITLYKNVRIDFEEKEYPKYDKGLVYLDDYIHSENLIARAYILAHLLEYDDEKYLKNKVNKNLLKEQIKNKTILKIATERNKLEKFKTMLEKLGLDYESI
jgi:hypothetical protein